MNCKTSSVDFIPTSLIKLCPFVFAEIITKLANMSFSQGIFPAIFKSAAVLPLLKKPNLDPDLPSNYRPISNLNNISKLLERLFLLRFQPHVQNCSNFNIMQSAYRPLHSTETSILPTLNSIYRSADSGMPTLLVSLDLSAAFDTIDHSTLLTRLHTSFGISGTCLDWLDSYLSSRTQTVRIGQSSSTTMSLSAGVPQGSVLGPILFSLYTSPLALIISHFGLSHQQYADDTQLYISLSLDNMRQPIEQLEHCLTSLHYWLGLNGLCLNPDKSDVVLFGTHKRLSSFPTITSVNVAGTPVSLSDHTMSLGITLDAHLTFNQHVSTICQKTCYHLRAFRHIRHALTDDMAKSVATSLIQSRLDYCNAALYGISAANITRLKRLQNMASRITLQDWHQSSNALLRRLHWLPVDKRIEFKIACLTYKLISTEQPIYLRSLLSFQSRPRALRSSNQNLLTQPRSKLAFGERAFSSCAPKIWNRLPFAVRSALTLQTFKAGLKTYLFSAA
jgi:hypothetical protein